MKTDKKTVLRCRAAASMTMAVIIMTACNLSSHRYINGLKTGQPIMDGWTHEQAGEFWLASTLTDEWISVTNGQRGWMTAGELASLDNINVQVRLPVHDGNPRPREGVAYRQRSTGGYITFRDTVIAGDTLHTIGVADYRLLEPMYMSMDGADATSMVQSRGKGIFTLYHLRRVRDRQHGTLRYEPQWVPVVVSVYPGADSLLICRGNVVYEAYHAER